jgi:hypothetical protein
MGEEGGDAIRHHRGVAIHDTIKEQYPFPSGDACGGAAAPVPEDVGLDGELGLAGVLAFALQVALGRLLCAVCDGEGGFSGFGGDANAPDAGGGGVPDLLASIELLKEVRVRFVGDAERDRGIAPDHDPNGLAVSLITEAEGLDSGKNSH